MTSCFERLESRRFCSATSATLLVGDKLYTAVDGDGAFDGSDLYVAHSDGSDPSLLMHWKFGQSINLHTLFSYDGKLLFAASVTNNSVTPEPWISDGTADGTQQLADLHEGAAGSNPSAYHLVNGLAVFTAGHNSDLDPQVYVYDGDLPVHNISLDQYPYSSGARDVAYAADTITWDQSNESLDATQHFTSDGTTTWLINNDGTTTQVGGATPPPVTVTPPSLVNAHVRNGVLRVYGDSGANVIGVELNAGEVEVTVDAASASFDASTLSQVIVSAGDGNDRITIDGALRTKLYGEAGNDTINGGAGKDRIYGGDGDDWIGGGENHDTIYGQAGDDKLFGDAGRDYLDGGAGANTLRGGAGIDHLMFTAADDVHANAGDRLTVDSIVA